jgi:hypothetical protein
MTARGIITQVLADNPGKEEKELRQLLSAAYPFGMRKYHPYKIWLDEIKRQLGPSTKSLRSVTRGQWKRLQEWNALYAPKEPK